MYLLFDLGKTNLRVAASRAGTKIDAIRVMPSPDTFKHAAAMIYATACELGAEKARILCGGIAAPLIQKTSRVAWKRPLWRDGSLAARLTKIFHAPVITENDAALAALGEAVYGGGKNHAVVAYLTISSGVGGARIAGKVIDEQNSGFEPGAQIILSAGNRSATLEDLIGGLAFEKRYKKKPYEIKDNAIWDNAAHFLACGIVNAGALWSPDIIVIGGSMMKHPGIPIARVKSEFNRLWKHSVQKPLIVPARLKDMSGLYGTLAHIKNCARR